MFNLKNLLSDAAKGAKQVKQVAKTYKKAQTDAPLTKKEQGTAKGLNVVSKVLHKPSTINKATAQIEQKATPEISVEKRAEKKKYGTSDTLAALISRMSPVKGTQDPLQQVFRRTQDKLNTARMATDAEIVALSVRDDSLKGREALDRIRNKEEYVKSLSSSKREWLTSRVVSLKGAIQQKKADEYLEKRKKYALTPEQAMAERGLDPLGATAQSRAMSDLVTGTGRESVGTALSSATMGLSDVIGSKFGITGEISAMYGDPLIKGKEGEFYEQTRLKPDEEALDPMMRTLYGEYLPKLQNTIMALVGGAGTYGAVASKIAKGLGGLKGPVGQALQRHPVFTTYLVQNPLEEVVEMAIRKGTGQQYTFDDFARGMAFGTVFSSLGIGRVKQEAITKNLEGALKEAENAKGGILTPREYQETVMNTRLLGNKTGRDLMNEAGYMFGERNLVYKTGKKGVRPGLDPAEVKTPEGAKLLIKEQLEADAKKIKGGKKTLVDRAKNFAYKAETGFFDKAAYVDYMLNAKVKEGALSKAEAGKFSEAYEGSIRSEKLANNFLKNSGFEDAVKAAAGKGMDEVGKVMTARQKLAMADHYKMSDVEYRDSFGTTREADRAIVDNLKGEYDAEIKMYNDSMSKLNDYMVETGLISAKEMGKLKEIYPDYVPLYRVDMEKADIDAFSNRVFNEASLSKQNVVQEFQGSTKPIKNPYEAFIDKARIAFREGEANRVAKTIADYGDIKGFEDTIKKLGKGEKAEYEIEYFVNGEKLKAGVPKEIYDFAKGAGVAKSNVVFDISRGVMRGFKAGTTGANPAFLLRNVVRDIQTAKINSKYGLKMIDVAIGLGSDLKTGLSQTALGKKLGLKEGKWESEYRARGGSGTSEIDIMKKPTVKQLSDIAAIKDLPNQGFKTKVKYVTKGFKKAMAALEKALSVSEDATRLGVLRRNYYGYLKDGFNEKEAMRLAMQESLDATANFLRGGRFKNVITGLYPYQSAGFAGGRSFQKSMKRDPAMTAFRIAKNVVLPEATLMAWNLMDDKRKKIYEDIPDWEKDMNYIAITPWAKWSEENNRWEGVYKIPKPPGIAALSVPVRKEAEKMLGVEGGGSLATDWVNAMTSPALGLDIQEDLSSSVLNYIPHVGKIPLEIATNKNFYTGKDLVSSYLQKKSAEEQAYEWTPDVYKYLGEKLGVSPLQIRHVVKGYGGSATEQVIGAKNPIEEIIKGFSGTYGGRMEEVKEKAAEKKGSPLSSGGVRRRAL